MVVNEIGFYRHFYNFPTTLPTSRPKIAIFSFIPPDITTLEERYKLRDDWQNDKPTITVVYTLTDAALVESTNINMTVSNEINMDLEIVLLNSPPNSDITIYILDTTNYMRDFAMLIKLAVDDGQQIFSYSYAKSESASLMTLANIYTIHKYLNYACEHDMIVVCSSADGGSFEADNFFVRKYYDTIFRFRTMVPIYTGDKIDIYLNKDFQTYTDLKNDSKTIIVDSKIIDSTTIDIDFVKIPHGGYATFSIYINDLGVLQAPIFVDETSPFDPVDETPLHVYKRIDYNDYFKVL